MIVNLLPSGRLRLEGYGRGYPQNGDAFIEIDLHEAATVLDLIDHVRAPRDLVSLIMVNARQCPVETRLKAGDRVILASPDVAAFWRCLGQQNLGMDSVFDFGDTNVKR